MLDFKYRYCCGISKSFQARGKINNKLLNKTVVFRRHLLIRNVRKLRISIHTVKTSFCARHFKISFHLNVGNAGFPRYLQGYIPEKSRSTNTKTHF